MKQNLPGILRVGYVRCSALMPNIRLRARAGVPVAVLTDINWLNIHSDATCQTVISYDNHGEVESTTLQFYTSDKLPARRCLSFVVETIDGGSWLIGSAEPPFPTIELTHSTGEVGGQRAGTTVKVTLKSIKSFISLDK